MTSICRLASNQDELATRIAPGAYTLRAVAGFDMHLAITVIDPGAAKVASSGVTVLSPEDPPARAGELAAMLNQSVV